MATKKKEELIVDSQEATEDNVINTIPEQSPIDEIEEFILTLGSDDLPTFGGSFKGGIFLQQVPSEIASCINTIVTSDIPTNSYLEIGSASGGATFVINHFLHPSNITIIDDNKHPRSSLRQGILQGIPFNEVIGNSHDQAVIDSITGPFDLILFDGATSYEEVSSDIANYIPKLSDSGVLIIHDTFNPGLGTHRISKELSQDPNLTLLGEYIATDGPACGIALFKKSQKG
jgi:predicted O-methyltransferase YrrM